MSQIIARRGAMTPHEIERAMDLKRAGRSNQHIARYLGRSMEEVARILGPSPMQPK